MNVRTDEAQVISPATETKLGRPPTDRSVKLRDILKTAALSTALISWYTTANGLHKYVFANLWMAYVVSAALQGALFALSIRGIGLLLGFKSLLKQVGFFAIWTCLLLASSIFSYVYISRDVYTDQLLLEDAHRVFREECLTENYNLRSSADQLLNGSESGENILKEMDKYVSNLAVLENGVDLSEDGSNQKLSDLRTSLLPYAYSNSGGITKIHDCVDTSNLIRYIDKILTGRFIAQDIIDAKDIAEKLNIAIEERKKSKERDQEIKTNDLIKYQERLGTFINTNAPDYDRLNKEVKDLETDIETISSIIMALADEQLIIREAPVVLQSVSSSMSVSLYNSVREIRIAMNQEKINTELVKELAGEIYDTLLENNSSITADDFRLTGYSSFKGNLEKYAAVIEAQQWIDNELQSLYNLKSIAELTEETNGNTTWSNYWQTHLNALKRSAQRLQVGGLDGATISNLITKLERIERLYLSDLNDFERAWSLLFGPHPYKALLKFSFFFSFGIDLFSVFMSILLYLLRPKRRCNPQNP